MTKQLQQFDVPAGEKAVRIAFPNGQTFRLRMRDDRRIRFVVETDEDVRMVGFDGRGGDATVALEITRSTSAEGGG